MTIADYPAHRARRPSHRPAPGALLKRRRRRRRSKREIGADVVLHHLVAEGLVFDHAGLRWLLVPLDDRRIERIVVALAEAEDDEPNGDLEPRNPGGETELGWANEGSQANLSTGYTPGGDLESDGDCDAEHDDPGGDVLDKGEFDPCDLGEPADEDGSNPPQLDADIDAQRGRIASAWPLKPMQKGRGVSVMVKP